MSATSRELEILAVAGAQRRAAVDALVREGRRDDPPPAWLEGLRTGRLAVDGVFAAYRHGRPAAVAAYRCQPGRLGRVWPAFLAAAEPSRTALALYQRIDGALESRHVRLAFAQLDHAGSPAAEPLRASGYAYLSELAYLVSFRSDAPETRPRTSFELAPYREQADRRELLRVLEQTYEDTQDLPSIRHAFSPETTLAGYEETTAPENRHWYLARERGVAVGCLLQSNHPATDHWEVDYLGLARPARGRGWGLELVRHGQWEASRAGRARVGVLVDLENEAANRVYAAAGFRLWQSRPLFVKIFDSSPATSRDPEEQTQASARE